jgi:hypothetical protein
MRPCGAAKDAESAEASTHYARGVIELQLISLKEEKRNCKRWQGATGGA